ncbi:MAG: phage integrase N-terminal SAM-like domain-containing protein [Oceanospirillales bacterium]|nr:phage integrase N-terminal SAM-like domain-containing protein [Oceanospirillales bacterium]
MQLRRVELNGLSCKTKQAHCHWVKRFIRFHDMQHPSVCSATEAKRFLSHLAIRQTNRTRFTEFYTHAVRKGGFGVRSSVDDGF